MKMKNNGHRHTFALHIYILCPYIVHSHNFVFAANASPKVTVDKTFNVTVGHENVLAVTTSDSDGDTVILKLDSNRPDGATFENNKYTWTPTNMDPMNISYVSCVLFQNYAYLIFHFTKSEKH